MMTVGLLAGTVKDIAAKDPKELLGNLIGDPRDRVPIKRIRSDVDWTKPLAGNAYGQNINRPAIPAIASYPPRLTSLEAFPFKEIETILNYTFRTPFLLFAAFTHVTVDPFYCNERLEWLGDAALDWLTTRYFYQRSRGRPMTPYELTEARKASVNNAAFAQVTLGLGLHRHLRINAPELQADIERFVKGQEEVESDGATSATDDGGKQAPPAPKVMGDIFEAMAGAVLLDCQLDLDAFDAVLLPLLEDRLRPLADPTLLRVSPISRCMTAYAKLGITRPVISIDFVTDPATNRRSCRVIVAGRTVGEAVVEDAVGPDGELIPGGAKARAQAKERAAQQALDYVLKNGIVGLTV
jgi:dsRNA-specific ribonuclease